MAITQNTYTGNGSTVLFSFTFPYLETSDIKVSVNGVNTTAYTLANATTVQFNAAPANGAAIRIYRQTDDAALASTFYPGSAIRSQDLNDNFTQNLYVTQESSNNAASATTTANTALANSSTAINTANASTATANTALSNSQTALTQSSSAVSTANSASSSASSAVSTANSAATNAATALTNSQTALTQSANAVTTANQSSSTAGTALTNSQTALSQSSSAVSTATTAASNASTALSNSQTALTQSASATSSANTAISTANAAASAVANAILYDTVANVAAIPASPANNDAVEVVNSTGIESFSPLSGRPAGFVGDSGLSVRMVYTTTGATWNWIQYFPNDPETRYGDAITTLQTDLNTAEADILALDSAKLDATTAASTYQTQAGMSAYLATGAIGTTVQAYNANTAVTNAVQSFTAAQRGAVTALTDGATITPNFSLSNNWSLTLGGSRTLANPTNLTAGQTGVIVITNGAYTLSFGGYWKFPGGTAPTLTQNGTDVLAYYVDSSTRITARLISDVK